MKRHLAHSRPIYSLLWCVSHGAVEWCALVCPLKMPVCTSMGWYSHSPNGCPMAILNNHLNLDCAMSQAYDRASEIMLKYGQEIKPKKSSQKNYAKYMANKSSQRNQVKKCPGNQTKVCPRNQANICPKKSSQSTMLSMANTVVTQKRAYSRKSAHLLLFARFLV